MGKFVVTACVAGAMLLAPFLISGPVAGEVIAFAPNANGCLIVGRDAETALYECGDCDTSGTIRVDVFAHSTWGLSVKGTAICVYGSPESPSYATGIKAECTVTVPPPRADDCSAHGTQINGKLNCRVDASGIGGWYVRCRKL